MFAIERAWRDAPREAVAATAVNDGVPASLDRRICKRHAEMIRPTSTKLW